MTILIPDLSDFSLEKLYRGISSSTVYALQYIGFVTEASFVTDTSLRSFTSHLILSYTYFKPLLISMTRENFMLSLSQ